MPTTRGTLILVLSALLTLPPAALLAEEDLVTVVADGQPWTSTGPNGRKVTLIFFPDGTARMKFGGMSRKLKWLKTDGALCMIGAPRGDRCLRLERSATGFIGHSSDGTTVTLDR
jgi:hypothetical protein